MSFLGRKPSLEVLWLSQEPAVQARRLDTLLACFNLSSSREDLQAVESPLRALCCLLIYIFVQVNSELAVLIYNKYIGATAATRSGLTFLERCESFCGPVPMTSFHRAQVILQVKRLSQKVSVSASQWWCVFILRTGCPLRILR